MRTTKRASASGNVVPGPLTVTCPCPVDNTHSHPMTSSILYPIDVLFRRILASFKAQPNDQVSDLLVLHSVHLVICVCDIS